MGPGLMDDLHFIGVVFSFSCEVMPGFWCGVEVGVLHSVGGGGGADPLRSPDLPPVSPG